MDSKREKTIKTTKTLRFDHDDVKNALIAYFSDRFVGTNLLEYEFDKLDFNLDVIECLEEDSSPGDETLVSVVLVREEEAQN